MPPTNTRSDRSCSDGSPRTRRSRSRTAGSSSSFTAGSAPPPAASLAAPAPSSAAPSYLHAFPDFMGRSACQASSLVIIILTVLRRRSGAVLWSLMTLPAIMRARKNSRRCSTTTSADHTIYETKHTTITRQALQKRVRACRRTSRAWPLARAWLPVPPGSAATSKPKAKALAGAGAALGSATIPTVC